MTELIPENLQTQESQLACCEESTTQTHEFLVDSSSPSTAHMQDSPEGLPLAQESPEVKRVDACHDPDKEDVVPALVVTKTSEAAKLNRGPGTPQDERRETDTQFGHTTIDHRCSDAAYLSCSDLQSLRSDTLSLASEAAISAKSDEQECLEDDTQSVTASSITSLFHRLQMDPLERDWLRCAALGNTPALHQLLEQDPTLASRKDFVTGFTALHWAAKQGRLETVDMMARAGADVNLRSVRELTVAGALPRALHLEKPSSTQIMPKPSSSAEQT
ncbi:ankyrin repeat domain-containing protein SOWAHA [Alosa alosa]|uniref:ankyrin repeat domain-containing protein SOWAHA n=1 Tax=Alosa alosa TaxID=278164 RepID=UPI0020152678|nr:ankyrin repeat domain-containing protein SOWAHA [Alosa alosa]